MFALGIDFGTSNSAAAVCSSFEDVRLAQFERPMVHESQLPQRSGPTETLPSVLFVPWGESTCYCGYEAIERYLQSGMDGRFLQSFKSFLPSRSFPGTIFGGKKQSLEDIVALYLTRLIERASASLGVPFEGPVVLGRPARFSDDPDLDALAENRLRKAAALAGLREVTFVIEPVAAALSYEATLDAEQVVMVADLGGGTSDFTIMRLGPQHRSQADRASSILASGGLSVAGDKFDGEIVRAKVLPQLGLGSEYRTITGPARVPAWLFSKLLQWNHISFLKQRDTLEFLRTVRATSTHPEAIDGLLRLVDEDLGYVLFRNVELAKRAASAGETAHLERGPLDLPLAPTTLTRDEFEAATSGLLDQLRATALDVLNAAELTPANVHAVFLTGGTSLLPQVRALFVDMFDEARLQERSTFCSVVDGLARSALARA